MSIEKSRFTNFPIGPKSAEMKPGLYVVPVVGDIMANMHDGRFNLAINSLDAFQERSAFIPEVIEKYSKITSPDSVWHDKAHYDESAVAIKELLEAGYLQEEQTVILKCKCSKTELTSEAADSNPNLKTITREGSGALICNLCDTPCDPREDDSLFFRFPENIPTPSVVPNNCQKDTTDLTRRTENTHWRVSRLRSGVMSVGQHVVDTDFVWMSGLADEMLRHGQMESQTLIGTTHVMRHLSFILGIKRALAKARGIGHINQHDNTIIVPYITPTQNQYTNDAIREFVTNDPTRFCLSAVSSLRWRPGSGPWNDTAIAAIARAPSHRVTNAIEALHEPLSPVEKQGIGTTGIHRLKEQFVASKLK